MASARGEQLRAVVELEARGRRPRPARAARRGWRLALGTRLVAAGLRLLDVVEGS